MTVVFTPFDYIEKAALRAAFYVGFGHKISSLMKSISLNYLFIARFTISISRVR